MLGPKDSSTAPVLSKAIEALAGIVPVTGAISKSQHSNPKSPIADRNRVDASSEQSFNLLQI